MITLLSPAKTLDFESPLATEVCTEPDFLSFSDDLIQGLTKLSPVQIGKLIKLRSML